jgi:hypothetical protein
MGLVQTGDTGQINWTTVLAPLAINTSQGYEIWRFADTMQATTPVFFKIEYGSGGAVNNPSLWLTVGSGSNGTGSLTGVTTIRRQFSSTVAATLPVTAHWSGDTNRFCFVWRAGVVGQSLYLGIERSNDGTDTLTSEAVLVTAYSASLPAQVCWNTAIGPITVYEATFGALAPEAPPLGVSGTQVAVYPIFLNKGVFMNFCMNLFSYFDATLAAGTVITFPVHGISHTFIAIGASSMTNTASRAPGGTSSGLMRYE